MLKIERPSSYKEHSVVFKSCLCLFLLGTIHKQNIETKIFLYLLQAMFRQGYCKETFDSFKDFA